jgi:predicted nucleotide-binding protein (sugar kinase/HSP70/actin superfamily)
MKITFPHMGNLAIALKAMFEALELEVILPPKTNQQTIALGSKYAREGACLPFKINLGNYLQAFELGADAIVMLGGSGPCRFGYFGRLHQAILQDLGYNFPMLILEKGNFKANIDHLRQQAGGKSWPEVGQAIRLGWSMLKAMDGVEGETHLVRPWEQERGATSRIYQEFLESLAEAKSSGDVEQCRAEALGALNHLLKAEKGQSKNKARPLKIGLVGDIYMLLEPVCNAHIEEFLGELGVEVTRSIYLSHWVSTNLIGLERTSYGKGLLRAARPFLGSTVGGHGLDSVGNTVNYAAQGYDGVIQILPLTCMPEIVAKGILPKVSATCGIPVLNLVVDENSSDVGMKTRVEAFVDMLARKVIVG